ncbi:hypothetical protein SDJN03_24667, partial [Cucurbita argyrosperma subsp. sororia]
MLWESLAAGWKCMCIQLAGFLTIQVLLPVLLIISSGELHQSDGLQHPEECCGIIVASELIRGKQPLILRIDVVELICEKASIACFIGYGHSRYLQSSLAIGSFRHGYRS